MTPVSEVLTGRTRPALFMLFGAVGLVLLVACANIANLILVRSAAHQRETAVRVALGAISLQLVRVVLAETAMVSIAGTTCAVGVAWASLVVPQTLRPDIPRMTDAAITPEVVALTAATTIAVALLFGLAPILTIRDAALRGSLNDGGRTGSGGVATARVRKLLVACQMAIACVLLVTGGLLRSLTNHLRVDTGFQSHNAVMFDLYLPNSRYPDATGQTRFYRGLVHDLEQTPGVESAGGLLYFPYKPKLWLSSLWVEDAPVGDGEQPIVYYNLAAGDYFKAMGIPLVRGRWPDEREVWEQSRVVVVNESLVRQVFA